MAKDTATTLKKGDRVVATVPFREVPEGTPGKLKMVEGLGPWIRAWVQFDNGVWMGSIGVDKLTTQADWPAYQKRRAEEAENASRRQAEQAAAPVAEAPAAGGGDAPASTSKVPAHLLERAKAARERKAAAAAGD